MLYVTILVTVAFAIARFLLPVDGPLSIDVFKDLAHVWVGGLFGAAIGWTITMTTMNRLKIAAGNGATGIELLIAIRGGFDQAVYSCGSLWTMAIGLTFVEVIAFIINAR